MQTTHIVGMAVEAAIVLIGIPLMLNEHRTWSRRHEILARAPRRPLLLRFLLWRHYRKEERRAKLRRRQAIANRIVEEEIRIGRAENAKRAARRAREVARWKEIFASVSKQLDPRVREDDGVQINS